jgi:hypothetical protein
VIWNSLLTLVKVTTAAADVVDDVGARWRCTATWYPAYNLKSPPSVALVAPPVLTPPPLQWLADMTPRRHAGLELLAAAAALLRMPVATAPARRRTPPPPVRYNDQTLTQMDWDPPITEPDKGLPPGVTSVTNATNECHERHRCTVFLTHSVYHRPTFDHVA